MKYKVFYDYKINEEIILDIEASYYPPDEMMINKIDFEKGNLVDLIEYLENHKLTLLEISNRGISFSTLRR
jgi:hypothetical protein